MGPQDAQLSSLVREIAELNAVLRGQAERDFPVRRKLFDDRFLGRERSLAFREVNLSFALTDEEFNFPGSVLFADSLSTGTATIKFDSKEAPAFPFKAATGLLMPFRKFFLSCAAQAGDTLRLWYGFDVGIIPPNQDIASISSIGTVDSITPTTVCHTPYFRWSASSALGTLVAPASNVSGIVVYGYGFVGDGSSSVRIMTKTSAPSAWNDATADSIGVHFRSSVQFQNRVLPILIPSGKGLYEQAEAATTTGVWIDYEVL